MDTIIDGYQQNSISLLPPQIYELCRFANFRKLSDLVNYLSQCQSNEEYRIERLLGVCYKTPDAMILVMPGDDFYPSDASFTTAIIPSNKTLKEFDSQRQNRLIMLKKGNRPVWQVQYKNIPKKSDLDIQPLTDGWKA